MYLDCKTQYDDTFFLHFLLKVAEVARQSDINIASEWGPLAPLNK